MSTFLLPITHVSGMAQHLTTTFASVLGAPLVFCPTLDYEETVKQYRTQMGERYEEQKVNELINQPTLVAWRRSALRRQDTFNKRAKPQQFVLKVSRSGEITGETLRLVELLGEFDLQFRIFSRDIEYLEDFEIKYLSGFSVQQFKRITAKFLDKDGEVSIPNLGVDFGASEWDINLDWSSELTDQEFDRSDNFVISQDFNARVYGSFFSVLEGRLNPRVIFNVEHESHVKE